MFTEDEPNYPLNWTSPHQSYSNHLDGYIKTILYYIIDNSELHPIIDLKDSDNPNQHDNTNIFIQNVMFASFLIAYNRIRSDAKSIDFFGAEIIPFVNKEILNIYLTPFGMNNFLELQSWDKDLMLSNFNSFVKKVGFNRIYDKERLSELNTLVLLEKDNKFYYYAKPIYYDYATEFIMEKLRRPHITSIKFEMQASYEQVT